MSRLFIFREVVRLGAYKISKYDGSPQRLSPVKEKGVIINGTRFYLISQSESASFSIKLLEMIWRRSAENMARLRKMSLQLILKNKAGNRVKIT